MFLNLLNVFNLHTFIGMLSKSMGQILRVAACLQCLFDLDGDYSTVCDVSREAVIAAMDLVEVCCQHTAYIAGRGEITQEIEIIDAGK